MPEIFIGADHRGYELKQSLVAKLSGAASPEEQISVGDYTVSDLGPFAYNPDDDFNDAAQQVARAVRENPDSRGILICGSTHGVAMQANRFKGIRAIAAYNPELAVIGRKHNDANILCLSADFTKPEDVPAIVKAFLTTDFSGEERYKRRNARLDEEV